MRPLLITMMLLSCGTAGAQEQPAPIVVHRTQYRPQYGWISQSAGEHPDITLIPRGEGARSGRLWVRSVDNGLLIAGEVDGAQPEFPRSMAQMLSKDHVEVWLSATPTMDLPAIGWGNQFEDRTLAEGEDSCRDWAKELQDQPGLETKCREWAVKQLRYRSYFKLLFMRQWLVTPDFVVEAYATPAHEEILKRFAGKGDEALEVLKPRGGVQMRLFPKQAGYSFEIVIPYDAFPPLPALIVKELYLLVDVFNSAAPGKKEGAYSTSSAARAYGTPETFNILRLDPPHPYHLSPCDLPLTGTDKRENFHPAWFLPDPDPATRYEADTFIILNDPAGYRYEPEGLSPTIRRTHYFWLEAGPGEWVCGPRLTYRKGGRTESYPFMVSEKGFESKRLADGDLLIKTGPRVWYSEFGSGQCGACPRTDLRILDLTKEMKVFGALGLGEVISNGNLLAQDYSLSPDWSQVTEYNLTSDDKGEPRAWSSTTWCRKLNTRRYDARAYVYENCGEKDNVKPPNPPVLKELREIPN